ncbi:peptidyl-prolyl cis-trans isomerase (macronuclear) [Tetrahymena thermophila SB210]|uniref:Peptidyl-prolyl cis-trans isomerase FKBP4 n=1 Tax=Tetrahymena thermophila (strain SB210) TaxID=312017 RepID=I7M1D4_TETTS|nr:peptidyl-prolyl cis-trans isomerase [Tetrahymena thermophila SB210]EAR96113.1 peptidyl-prolyl cis-trans isomerase [Tetrahymena thermophila SB210]|eukprot:XP_001016358.1 peptidyl-prolyl cis-trans isomerase [Tetrahymena thermophila SB210]
MTAFTNVDEKGLLQKQIIKDGIGDCPEKYREVYVYFVLRNERGDLITGTESQPYKVVMGRGDSFQFMEQLLLTMKLGERILAKIDKQLVKDDKKLSKLVNNEEMNLELEIEIVRLMNYRNSLWELESDDREALVQTIKNQGNEFIKNKEYQNATYKYESGLKTIKNDQNSVFDEVQQSLLNNLSLAYLKNNQFAECIETATEALKSQPSNVKLLYRRAQAYSGTQEYEKAKSDLKEGLKLDPNNAELQKELNALINKEKIQIEKEKKVYANMFK